MQKPSLRVRWTGAWGGTVLLLALIFAGCAGTRGATEEGRAEEEGVATEEEAIVHASYEEFDPAPYRDEPPTPAALVHDVPDRLMEGTVGTGATRTLEGFRIQLYQTQNPEQADEFVEQATAWWRMQKQAGAAGALFGSESAPVYNVWRQPYYRVRVGDFDTRDAAEAALEEVRIRFGGAFVVPDRVTVMR